jgi:predicted lipoprotein with Yx(FWY)xxD motif
MMMKKRFVILIVLIAVVACLAGCTTTQPPTTPTPTATTQPPVTSAPATPPPSAPTILLGSNATLGAFLTDASGMTLYYFALDVPGNGTTACDNPVCLGLWTPFYAGSIVVSPPLQATDFATISGNNGSPLTTYRGWPLYLYKGDTAAGDTNGDGFKNVWYVMKPDYSVVIMDNVQVGPYLAGPTGMTLYNFSPDKSGQSFCFNTTSLLIEGKTCLELWPPFAPAAIVAPSGLNQADFSTLTSNVGKPQVSYKGWPLYYFALDTAPGQLNGENLTGFGGTWYVVAPDVSQAPVISSGGGGGGGGY